MTLEYITAAQTGDFATLKHLLDIYNPDLASDEFMIKAADVKKSSYVITASFTNSDTVTGIMPTLYQDYFLIEQIVATSKGLLHVNPVGEYTYRVTDPVALGTINDGGTYNVEDTAECLYKKVVVIGSLSYELLAYAAHGSDVATVQKLLDLGCCPNSNTTKQRNFASNVAISRGMSTSNAKYDKFSSDSRALLNAVRANKLDVVEALINFACPCCGGKGAKISLNILAEANKSTDAIKVYLKGVI